MRTYEWIIPAGIMALLGVLAWDGLTSQRVGMKTLEEFFSSGQKARVLCQENRFSPDGVPYVEFTNGNVVYNGRLKSDDGRVIEVPNYRPSKILSTK